MFVLLNEEFGDVSFRLDLVPTDESAYIDEITLEQRAVDADNYDFNVLSDVAKHTADLKRANTLKDLVDKRAKMHGAIREKVDDAVLKRARLQHADAFTSMYTPTEGIHP